MNFKNCFIIFSLFILLMCSVGAISAVSDDASGNITSIDSQDDILTNNDENNVLNTQKQKMFQTALMRF